MTTTMTMIISLLISLNMKNIKMDYKYEMVYSIRNIVVKIIKIKYYYFLYLPCLISMIHSLYFFISFFI